VQGLLAYVFLPVAYLMGVAGEDVHAVATLLAERVVLTEFSSYLKLSGLSGSISERSATIAAYALCGFAHIPSIAIFVGGISAIVPEKKAELAAVAWRAFIAATLACLMTGAVAGVFYREGAMLISGS
jgi:CNT family concentrative nucleoside transporter